MSTAPSSSSTPGPAPSPSSPEETSGALIIDGISYIPSSVLLAGIPKFSFKDDSAFGVTDQRGESPRAYAQGSELGIYFHDTRYLSIWETNFNGAAPIPLSQELRYGGSTIVLSMTNPDMPRLDGQGRIPRDTLLIRRILCLREDTLYEMLALRNFDTVPHALQFEQWAGSRFDDVFEVRGFPRARRGRSLAPHETRSNDGCRTTMLSYEGLDGRVRRTFIHRLFEAEKIRLSPTLSGDFSRVEVPAKGDLLLRTIVSFDEPSGGQIRGRKFADLSVAEFTGLIKDSLDGDALRPAGIVTDNAILNRAIENAAIDVRMLLTREEGVLYPYAGIPWFSAPFGRDGIITAYQLLPWYPQLARGVLDYALSRLGSRHDDFTDEQPGKVFHEMRRGEMSLTREVPFIPYYGSVDSTPLALCLLHEYVSWTLDLDKLREWWPSALRALEWVRKWGDPDGDGFLEYARQSATGLVNQGWKDSHDSVMHADGRLAQAPIRLCEVQAYAFRAIRGMSALARLMNDDRLADELRLAALQLRARFNERFWNPQGRFVHLALDGDSRPCAVRSSNMGHALWADLLSPGQAEDVTRHLMSDAMFSGHGIRTLADTEKAYNPLSYHNGSIWPHDNSLIMEGFRRYGQTAALERLSLAMIGVLESSHDFRLPELFCGFRLRGQEPPVPYQVACKPQAWAAGSLFLMIKSMLGLSMDADQSHVTFHSPLLTSKVGDLQIRGLRGRDWEMDIAFRRGAGGNTSLEVLRRTGNIRVLNVK